MLKLSEDEIKSAREQYFESTGKVTDDFRFFEAKMNCFTDWLAFEELQRNKPKLWDEFKKSAKPSDEIFETLKSVKYSAFYFKKINFRKQIVMEDLIARKKFVLASDHEKFGLVEGDLFVGRLFTSPDGEHYLLYGFLNLPGDIKKIITKEVKKRAKIGSLSEYNFTTEVEKIGTKVLYYPHVPPTEIFKFI